MSSVTKWSQNPGLAASARLRALAIPFKSALPWRVLDNLSNAGKSVQTKEPLGCWTLGLCCGVFWCWAVGLAAAGLCDAPFEGCEYSKFEVGRPLFRTWTRTVELGDPESMIEEAEVVAGGLGWGSPTITPERMKMSETSRTLLKNPLVLLL